MHKFLRAAGFSMYQKKRDIDKLMAMLEERPFMTRCVEEDVDSNICEMRTEVAPGVGVSIVGEINEDGSFSREFYFPYLYSDTVSSKQECEVQRHAERETYVGMVEEPQVGISLIFYVQNFLDYHEKVLRSSNGYVPVESVNFCGLSITGKILLPIKKSEKQIRMAKAASKNRYSLIEAARNGDEEAMETLTIEDIDLYSRITKRAASEDIYSIVDSSFMPCGFECDQYSLIGEILDVREVKNTFTKEDIYIMKVNSNDLIFTVCINGKDLFGEPAVGRRFKGQIWMQGILNFA